MNAENMEVYCKNLNCADPEIHTSPFTNPVASRKYRRMNYMGARKLGILKKAFISAVMDDDEVSSAFPVGLYHFYQCPVCGEERMYVERNGLLSKVRNP